MSLKCVTGEGNVPKLDCFSGDEKFPSEIYSNFILHSKKSKYSNYNKILNACGLFNLNE